MKQNHKNDHLEYASRNTVYSKLKEKKNTARRGSTEEARDRETKGKMPSDKRERAVTSNERKRILRKQGRKPQRKVNASSCHSRLGREMLIAEEYGDTRW